MNHGIDDIGRCEVCGRYVLEVELVEVDRLLTCPDCHIEE